MTIVGKSISLTSAGQNASTVYDVAAGPRTPLTSNVGRSNSRPELPPTKAIRQPSRGSLNSRSQIESRGSNGFVSNPAPTTVPVVPNTDNESRFDGIIPYPPFSMTNQARESNYSSSPRSNPKTPGTSSHRAGNGVSSKDTNPFFGMGTDMASYRITATSTPTPWDGPAPVGMCDVSAVPSMLRLMVDTEDGHTSALATFDAFGEVWNSRVATTEEEAQAQSADGEGSREQNRLRYQSGTSRTQTDSNVSQNWGKPDQGASGGGDMRGPSENGRPVGGRGERTYGDVIVRKELSPVSQILDGQSLLEQSIPSRSDSAKVPRKVQWKPTNLDMKPTGTKAVIDSLSSSSKIFNTTLNMIANSNNIDSAVAQNYNHGVTYANPAPSTIEFSKTAYSVNEIPTQLPSISQNSSATIPPTTKKLGGKRPIVAGAGGANGNDSTVEVRLPVIFPTLGDQWQPAANRQIAVHTMTGKYALIGGNRNREKEVAVAAEGGGMTRKAMKEHQEQSQQKPPRFPTASSEYMHNLMEVLVPSLSRPPRRLHDVAEPELPIHHNPAPMLDLNFLLSNATRSNSSSSAVKLPGVLKGEIHRFWRCENPERCKSAKTKDLYEVTAPTTGPRGVGRRATQIESMAMAEVASPGVESQSRPPAVEVSQPDQSALNETASAVEGDRKISENNKVNGKTETVISMAHTQTDGQSRPAADLDTNTLDRYDTESSATDVRRVTFHSEVPDANKGTEAVANSEKPVQEAPKRRFRLLSAGPRHTVIRARVHSAIRRLPSPRKRHPHPFEAAEEQRRRRMQPEVSLVRRKSLGTLAREMAEAMNNISYALPITMPKRSVNVGSDNGQEKENVMSGKGEMPRDELMTITEQDDVVETVEQKGSRRFQNITLPVPLPACIIGVGRRRGVRLRQYRNGILSLTSEGWNQDGIPTDDFPDDRNDPHDVTYRTIPCHKLQHQHHLIPPPSNVRHTRTPPHTSRKSDLELKGYHIPMHLISELSATPELPEEYLLKDAIRAFVPESAGSGAKMRRKLYYRRQSVLLWYRRHRFHRFHRKRPRTGKSSRQRTALEAMRRATADALVESGRMSGVFGENGHGTAYAGSRRGSVSASDNGRGRRMSIAHVMNLEIPDEVAETQMLHMSLNGGRRNEDEMAEDGFTLPRRMSVMGAPVTDHKDGYSGMDGPGKRRMSRRMSRVDVGMHLKTPARIHRAAATITERDLMEDDVLDPAAPIVKSLVPPFIQFALLCIKRLEAAILKIQSVWRKALSRSSYTNTRYAAIIIQRWYRVIRVKIQYQKTVQLRRSNRMQQYDHNLRILMNIAEGINTAMKVGPDNPNLEELMSEYETTGPLYSEQNLYTGPLNIVTHRFSEQQEAKKRRMSNHAALLGLDDRRRDLWQVYIAIRNRLTWVFVESKDPKEVELFVAGLAQANNRKSRNGRGSSTVSNKGKQQTPLLSEGSSGAFMEHGASRQGLRGMTYVKEDGSEFSSGETGSTVSTDPSGSGTNESHSTTNGQADVPASHTHEPPRTQALTAWPQSSDAMEGSGHFSTPRTSKGSRAAGGLHRKQITFLLRLIRKTGVKELRKKLQSYRDERIRPELVVESILAQRPGLVISLTTEAATRGVL